MAISSPTAAMAAAREERHSNVVHQYPARELGVHSMVLVFKNYRYENSRSVVSGRGGRARNTRAIESMGNAIVLPIPTNLTDTFSMRVTGAELGAFGSVAAGAAQKIMDAGGNVESATRGLLDQYAVSPEEIAKMIVTGQISEHRAAQVKSLVKSQLDAMGLGRPIDAATGRISNPHMTLMFEGMDLKSHTFNWNMAPKNVEDSEAIKNILNLIRRNALPEYEDSSLMAKGLLKFPNVVDVFFTGLDENYFMFFKTCMIQSISTDFSPSGMAILKGGKPAFVNLTLQLMEMNIHTAGDYY